MSPGSNKMISDFAGKPTTQSYFVSIAEFAQSLGPLQRHRTSQVSFSVRRKFLWLWAYEKTGDGTLYLTVLLDRAITDPRFHYVSQVSKNRWNHHVEVKSEAIVRSDWLRNLIREGYEFAQR